MATALDLSPQDWKDYVQAASRRLAFQTHKHSTEVANLQRTSTQTRVSEAAKMLKSQFGARRVILFGSLAHAGWFSPDSDVDLAVEGLAAKDYWNAWKAIEGIVDDRPVDLIDLETASESLRHAIERYGLEL